MNRLERLQLQLQLEVQKTCDAGIPDTGYFEGLKFAQKLVENQMKVGDTVRVLRLYEFTGPREVIEKQIEGSIQGQKSPGNGLTIKVADLGRFPEIMD